jgi:hypothetical protein
MAKFTDVAGWDAFAKIALPATAPIRTSRLVNMRPLWPAEPAASTGVTPACRERRRDRIAVLLRQHLLKAQTTGTAVPHLQFDTNNSPDITWQKVALARAEADEADQIVTAAVEATLIYAMLMFTEERELLEREELPGSVHRWAAGC